MTNTKNTPDQIHLTLAPLVRAAGQTHIARITGIAQPQISRWLSTGSGVSMSAMQRIAAAVGKQIDLEINDDTGIQNHE